MLWVPTARLLVLQRAVPAPLSGTALQRVTGLRPPEASVKVTLPLVGLLVPAAVAVNVTDAPSAARVGALVNVVVVGACCTPLAAAPAAAASVMPAPHVAVVQSKFVPVGNVRAVVWIIDMTCDGVSAGFADRISEVMPATCGVAMLVP